LIKEALGNVEDGVKINGVVVKSVQFADDQEMVSNSTSLLVYSLLRVTPGYKG